MINTKMNQNDLPGNRKKNKLKENITTEKKYLIKISKIMGIRSLRVFLDSFKFSLHKNNSRYIRQNIKITLPAQCISVSCLK